MPITEPAGLFSRMRIAARTLHVPLAGTTEADASPLDGLRLAAAISGAADGLIIGYIASLDDRTTVDAMREVAIASYQTSGLRESAGHLGGEYWSAWLAQRLQAQISDELARSPTTAAAAALALAESIHCIESSAVYRAKCDTATSRLCLENARTAIVEALTIIDRELNIDEHGR